MHQVQSGNGYVLSSIRGAGSDATLTACQPVNLVHVHALEHTEEAFFFSEFEASQTSQRVAINMFFTQLSDFIFLCLQPAISDGGSSSIRTTDR